MYWGRRNPCTVSPIPVGRGRAQCPLRAAGHPCPGLRSLTFQSRPPVPSHPEGALGRAVRCNVQAVPLLRSETFPSRRPQRQADVEPAGSGREGCGGGTRGGRHRRAAAAAAILPRAGSSACRRPLLPRVPSSQCSPGNPPPLPRPPARPASSVTMGNQILEGWEQMRLFGLVTPTSSGAGVES